MKDNYKTKGITEILLAVFAILTFCLLFTLYFYFTVNNQTTRELMFMGDVHFLRAEVVSLAENSKLGFVEINEVILLFNQVSDGIKVVGKIEGLVPGSSHGVHILEYADLLLLRNIKFDESNKDILKHFNPNHLPHSCPTLNNFNDEYHIGDIVSFFELG
jgi:hypothetical protein